MKNIFELMKEYELEIPEEKKQEFEKTLLENYKTIAEYDKKVKNAEGDRDKFKTMYETAKNTLEGFEGVDIEQLNRELEDWKGKAEAAEKKAKEDMEARDYQDAVKRETETLKFSSVSAKKAFLSELEAAKLPVKDGKVLGFHDFVEGYKKEDAEAFVDEETEHLEEGKAKFTQPAKGGTGGKKMSTAELMKLKNQNPLIDITQYL